MFGKGKSTPKKSSGEPFNWKQFLLNHCEKMILTVFLAGTGYLVYEGFTSYKFEPTKTPDDLKEKSSRARREIVEGNHNTEIMKDRFVKAKFAVKSERAREQTLPDPYSIGRLENKELQKGGKRGDPDVIAPVQLQVRSFFGTIAIASNNSAPADSLPNAPPVTDEKKRGRAKPAATSTTTTERKLETKYDKGYQHVATAAAAATSATPDTTRKAKPVDAKQVPKIVGFNAITAVINHEQLLSNFKTEFELAAGYQPDRDSPNYLGYQVQRADVTEAPDQEVAEEKWADAPECNTKEQLKMLDLWSGEAKEISLETYVLKDVLTMPIPPVLIADYKEFASHPLIPQIKVQAAAGGYGDQPGYGGDYGSQPAYGAGYGQEQSYGGPGGGPGGGFSAVAAMTVEETALVTAATPKITPFSKYKMIRFYDFGIKPNRVYRYRVRIVLEDPNFPRLEKLSPLTSSMKPETVARVQQLVDAFRDEVKKAGPKKKILVRDSKLPSKWSDPSDSISLKIPTELFANRVEATWTPQRVVGGQKEDFAMVESLAAKASMVYAEWDSKLALLVPKTITADRGTVLAGPSPEGGLDVIHPVSKIIKQITGFNFTNPVTVADVRGGQPLAAEKRPETRTNKDPLPSAGEVVAFDPRTGELVISREFNDLEHYRMYSFADEIEALEK